MREHCVHLEENEAGIMYVSKAGGAQPVRCCWCGRTFARTWTTTVEPMPGHGPHAGVVVRHWEKLPTDCPGLTVKG